MSHVASPHTRTNAHKIPATPQKNRSSTMMSLVANGARQRLLVPSCCHEITSRSVYIVVNPRKARAEKPKKKKGGGKASYRFVDRTRVRAAGGNGGKGNLSVFKIGRKHKRRPDGGHGGRGGNVIVVADPKQQSLNFSSPHVSAPAGSPGSSQERHGKDGKNLILRVPCGVVVRRVLDYDEVWDAENEMVRKVEEEEFSGDEGNVEYVFEMDLEEQSSEDDVERAEDDDCEEENAFVLPEVAKSIATDDAVAGNDMDSDENSLDSDATLERESVVLADLDKPGAHVVVARGGRGGIGNCTYAKRNGPLPDPKLLLKRAQAEEGEVAFLELELKLIADLGLVGFPNAGKSSLLAAMSRATPEIAPYPFTTLHPLVGCIEYRDGFRVMAADVPGLVRGASQGRGRGHDFLRHLERTKALLYLVDAAGVDGRGAVDDLLTLVDEISTYGDDDMLTRPSLVVANKLDLLNTDETEETLFALETAANDAGLDFSGDILGISAGVTGVGLEPLSKAIRSVVTESETQRNFDDYSFTGESYF